MNEFLDCIKNKYCCFEGRARRREYWMFVLFYAIGYFILSALTAALPVLGLLLAVYSFGLLLPGLGVTVRRLHDTGKSGWLILIALIPCVGGLILLVLECLDSTPGENQYGPNPKGL